MAEAEQKKEDETRRNVMIAMDGSKHAIYAFECKLTLISQIIFYFQPNYSL